MNTVTAVIMIGPSRPGELERMVATARLAAVSDTLASLRGVAHVNRVIVAAPESELLNPALVYDADVVWDLDPPGEHFHFGKRLAGIIQTYDLDRVIYIGAGSMPLYSNSALDFTIARIAEGFADKLAFTNNVHSADWVAFSEAKSAVNISKWLERDNMLAWRLRESAGFDVHSEPPSAGTRLDIDTPFDLQVLSLYPDLPAHLYRTLRSSDINPTKIYDIAEVLRRPGSRVTLIGRVPLAAWQALDSRRLWLRVISEERGMVANTRQTNGQVFSFLAGYIDQVGEEAFVARLAETSDLVLFDTRVYLAHRKVWPPAEERFASDLGQTEKIHDERLRALTEAAIKAPIPIVLGGHTLVSGGLYAVLELVQQGLL